MAVMMVTAEDVIPTGVDADAEAKPRSARNFGLLGAELLGFGLGAELGALGGGFGGYGYPGFGGGFGGQVLSLSRFFIINLNYRFPPGIRDTDSATRAMEVASGILMEAILALEVMADLGN